MKKIFALIAVLALALLGFAGPAQAGGGKPGTDEKPWICHPVNGKGETKTGWDLINPNKASSHIDEALYPDGHYWKHESKDGKRHDVYATGDKECPGGPEINELDVPAAPGVNDPCGEGNATWVVPGDTDVLKWEVVEGDLVVTIKTENTVFSGTDGDTSHNFGTAPEENTDECPQPPKTTKGEDVKVTYTSDYKCGQYQADVTKITETTPWTQVEGEPKVYGEPVVTNEVTKVNHELVPCTTTNEPPKQPKPPVVDHLPPVKHVSELPNTGGPEVASAGLAALLIAGGTLLLIRRKTK